MARPKPQSFVLQYASQNWLRGAGLDPLSRIFRKVLMRHPRYFFSTPQFKFELTKNDYLTINIPDISKMSSGFDLFYPSRAYFLYSASENWRIPLNALELMC
jgi:hypothetical protein